MMKIMIMMKRMMIMKGGREGTPGGGAGAGRGSSAGPRWAADFGFLCLVELAPLVGNSRRDFHDALEFGRLSSGYAG